MMSFFRWWVLLQSFWSFFQLSVYVVIITFLCLMSVILSSSEWKHVLMILFIDIFSCSVLHVCLQMEIFRECLWYPLDEEILVSSFRLLLWFILQLKSQKYALRVAQLIKGLHFQHSSLLLNQGLLIMGVPVNKGSCLLI